MITSGTPAKSCAVAITVGVVPSSEYPMRITLLILERRRVAEIEESSGLALVLGTDTTGISEMGLIVTVKSDVAY